MKIGVSELFNRPGRVGGAETMLHNLLEGLATTMSPEDEIVVFSNETSGTMETAPRMSYAVMPKWGRRNRFLQEAIVMPAYTGQCDVVLFPNYFTPPVTRGGRKVTVIHDLQYAHFPHNFSRSKRMWLRASHEMTLRQADAVITISEFCKRDIVDRYGERFIDKVHVIPNPISWDRLKQRPDASDARSGPNDFEGPYILSVAAQYPHKNLETLVRAFSKLRPDRPDVRLVLVGQLADRVIGMSRRSGVRDVIAELGLDDSVLVTGYVSDAELGEWYRHASLFVFPSLFEGFGMPPIEALGLGIPVLTTSCGSLSEIPSGMATVVADPMDPAEMAEAMREMLQNRHLYDQRQVQDRYSPQTVAKAYYRVLASSP
jgi:glycosyltransferase involved in cell wall biosynthesis